MLEHLVESQLNALAAKLTTQEVEAEAAIITQGETGDGRFFLAEGTAAAVVDTVGVVKNYFLGDYFGEVALLRDQPRSASVLAGSKGCRCWVLDQEQAAAEEEAALELTMLPPQCMSSSS